MFFILAFLRQVCCQGRGSRSKVVVSYVKDSRYVKRFAVLSSWFILLGWTSNVRLQIYKLIYLWSISVKTLVAHMSRTRACACSWLIVTCLVLAAVLHTSHRFIFQAQCQHQRANSLGSWNLLDIPCRTSSKCYNTLLCVWWWWSLQLLLLYWTLARLRCLSVNVVVAFCYTLFCCLLFFSSCPPEKSYRVKR